MPRRQRSAARKVETAMWRRHATEPTTTVPMTPSRSPPSYVAAGLETGNSDSGAGPAADAKSRAVCRPAAGACDVAESCDGVSDACPADAKSRVECRAKGGDC